MAILNLDLTNVDPSTGGQDPVPAGWYKVAMVESEMKPAKTTPGAQRLECVYSILEGQFINRKIFEGYNVVNPSEDAVRISYQQLRALGDAVGILQIGDSVSLHNIPFEMKVKVEAAQMEQPPAGSPPGTAPTEKYPPKNKVQAYRKLGAGGPVAGAVPAQFATPTPPAQAPAAAAAPAWQAPAGGQPWQPPGAAAPAAAQPAFAPPAAAVAAPAAVAATPPAQAPAAAAVTGLPATPPWMVQPAA